LVESVKRSSLLREPFSILPVVVVWGGGVVYRIPADLDGLDACIQLLDEICWHYQDDIAANSHLLTGVPRTETDHFMFIRFQRREIWRIGSFILFALNLELTLRRRYGDLLDFVGKLDPAVKGSVKRLLEARQSEIEDYKHYRDKVFAHTAYGQPRQDNPSMQATSLSYLEAIGGGITPQGIRVGAMSVVVGKHDPPRFKSFTFPEMAAQFAAHYDHWWEMFRDPCTVLEKSSDEDLKPHFPQVDAITRSGGTANRGVA
jgi:hypothetical protein